nr:MAPEG family protein [Paraburkholderia strydomiana]
MIAVGILTYWPRFVAWREMTRMEGGYDNNNPRAQQALLRGIGARAMAAHHNCLESLPFFGLGVLAALQRAVGIHSVAALCVLFLVVRIVFIVSYLRDHATLRSLAFMAGAGICLILYGLAACGAGNLT